jgi:S-adenosylmethionine:tRNA ribosyltransferase-isomerase
VLSLSDFDYTLPLELIAQHPLHERDEAKLLILNRVTGEIEHRIFSDIADYLKKDDLLIINDTKVLPARLFGRRATGGRVEVLLLHRMDRSSYSAMISPLRAKVGEKIIFDGGLEGMILGKDKIFFNTKDAKKIYSHGVMPLPPYIRRDVEAEDGIYYQTVYAKEEGAVAAPTAGLHFTESLLKRIKYNGVKVAPVTLHVGKGTFKPVESDNITAHKMDPEHFRIPEGTLKRIEEAKKSNKRIIAVGTTSLRALESFALGKKSGYTDLFIYPGFKFKLTNCLLTNFHLPKTTLFMLVCAFCGSERAKKTYNEAIENKYRFYSYGDAMLII